MLNFSRVMSVGLMMAASPVLAQDMLFSAKEIDAAPACSGAHDLSEGEAMLCHCASDAMSGSVWGSDAYTSDSNVCAAALHSGAVSPNGGAVVLTGEAGQTSYDGSERNGITTRDWGSYGSSFTVAAANAMTALAECGVLPSDVDRLNCQCPAGEGNTGRVWGFGPYTADSDICSAARHTGIIGTSGGVVTVLRVQGLESYAQGASNGVEASSWSSYGSSIVFDWNDQ